MTVYYPTERQLSALRLRATPMSFDDVGLQLHVTRERASSLTWLAVRRLKLLPDKENHPDWPLVSVVEKLVQVRST